MKFVVHRKVYMYHLQKGNKEKCEQNQTNQVQHIICSQLLHNELRELISLEPFHLQVYLVTYFSHLSLSDVFYIIEVSLLQCP